MYAWLAYDYYVMLSLENEDKRSYPVVFFFRDFLFAFSQVLPCTMSSRIVQQVPHTIDCTSVSQTTAHELFDDLPRKVNCLFSSIQESSRDTAE